MKRHLCTLKIKTKTQNDVVLKGAKRVLGQFLHYAYNTYVYYEKYTVHIVKACYKDY